MGSAIKFNFKTNYAQRHFYAGRKINYLGLIITQSHVNQGRILFINYIACVSINMNMHMAEAVSRVGWWIGLCLLLCQNFGSLNIYLEWTIVIVVKFFSFKLL